MNEQRLSRLQKWILRFLYSKEINIVWITSLKYHAVRSEGLFKSRPSQNSLHVIFSRSLRGLYYKKFIESFSGLHSSGLPKICLKIDGMEEMRGDPYCGMNLKSVTLTEEGQAKAKELLNVKNTGLNNKPKSQ